MATNDTKENELRLLFPRAVRASRGLLASVCFLGLTLGLLSPGAACAEIESGRRQLREVTRERVPPAASERSSFADSGQPGWSRNLACARQRGPRSVWQTPLNWGRVEFVSMEPETPSCAPDGRATLLEATHVTDVDEWSVFAGVLLDRRASRGERRRVEVSFLIPEETLETFDHVAALVAFDRDDPLFRRVGAALFREDLAIEIEDTDCRQGMNLYSFAPLSSPLEAGRWYRLESTLEPLGDDVLLTASVTDLETGEVLATTEEVTACKERWHSTSPMATGFMNLTERGAADPGVSVLLDDFVALSASDRPARSTPAKRMARTGR